MKRTLLLAVAANFCLGAPDGWAQGFVYRHRSTIAGDFLSSSADVIRAEGAYARDVAQAAAIGTRAARDYDDAVFHRTELRYQTLAMESQYKKQLYDHRKTRQQAAIDLRLQQAQRLWAQAQYGPPSWPAALGRPEFAASMNMIESVLRNWSPETSPAGDPYRTALVTEIGVVRARIASHPEVNFPGRVEAVRMLNSLALLAYKTSGGESLAMR